MAIFNITNNELEVVIKLIDFKADNVNITIDTTNIKISELQI